MILDLTLAFLAGLLSFASTCVLPLVPAYISVLVDRDGGVSSYQPFPLSKDFLDPALAKIL